jgi:hypothetical protein
MISTVFDHAVLASIIVGIGVATIAFANYLSQEKHT